MATGNFAYDNRCIVVTNEDYEDNNLPVIGERYGNDRSYPSNIVEGYEDFNYFDVIITAGYYEGACIDYVEKDEYHGIEYHCGMPDYFTNKDDLFAEVKANLNGISIYRMRQLCKGLSMENDGELIYEKIDEYLKDKEEEKANKALDGIKQYHGYDEVTCIGRASNGEAFYQKVS